MGSDHVWGQINSVYWHFKVRLIVGEIVKVNCKVSRHVIITNFFFALTTVFCCYSNRDTALDLSHKIGMVAITKPMVLDPDGQDTSPLCFFTDKATNFKL